MKIAIVTSPLIRVFPGVDHTPYSISAIAYNLAEELVKRGHDVSLFATSDSLTSAHLPKGLLKSTGIRVKKALRDIKEYKKIEKEHFERVVDMADNFDIIHGHDNNLIPYARFFKTPLVSTMHGPAVSRKENLRYGNEKMIALSKRQIARNPKLNFVGAAYNGINVSDFKFNAKPKDYVAWLGRITPLKGALEAIKAAQKANKKILLAGNLDENEKDYKEKVFKELEKSGGLAEYIGEVDRKQKVKLLSNASAVLMPIRWEEPFGLVAVEAMACGTPVIAFRKGALPEIVKHRKTGFIVDNIKEMALAISKADKISRKACRQSVEKEFTIERMADRYEGIYEEVINSM